MKRFWIGLGLLLSILAVGLWTTGEMGRIHTAISESLIQSAQAAEDGNWSKADEFAVNAAESWQDNWNFSAALADHTVLDEIDGLFAETEVYRKNRNVVAYAASCARLAEQIDAVQEGHKLSWWNLL